MRAAGPACGADAGRDRIVRVFWSKALLGLPAKRAGGDSYAGVRVLPADDRESPAAERNLIGFADVGFEPFSRCCQLCCLIDPR
jgi:hypothetical protein